MTRTTVILALAATCTLACGETKFELGAVKQASVPYEPHPAPPDSMEVAANPCKFGDVDRCVAKCEAGDANACNALGVMFEFGAQTSEDGALASSYYARACDSSYAPGCTNLGWLYSLGRGVPHDSTHAMALFTRAYEASRLACRRGDSSGCMMAGQALLEGRGVAQDDEAALAFFRRACDGGDRRGCDYVTMLR
jgi:TPR repeat protein